jgi:copper resistance protein B
MRRIARLLIGLAAAGSAMSAIAQHEGHEGHAAPVTDEAPTPTNREMQSGQEPDTAREAHTEHGDDAESADDAHADHGGQADHDAHADDAHTDHDAQTASSGPTHAADALFGSREMAAAREQLNVEHGALRASLIMADRFEARSGGGEDDYVWDVQGWYGSDIHRLWIKTEGEGELGENPATAEVQALYSRAITPFFNLQAGVRHDFRPSPERSHVVVGIQGLLPYVFEIDAAAFVSEDGDLSGRFEAEYDLRVKQRLVLQPRIELNFAAQSVPELGIGSGLGSVEGGFRLRYEIRREIAPYVGLVWERKLGGTARFARAAGGDSRSREVVVGIQAWF